MCTEGDGKPGNYGEALALVGSGLDHLGAAAGDGQIPEPALGESHADRIVAWTRRLPAGMLDVTDELILSVLRAGATASVLRTGLLPSPFNTRSVPIDVGYSDHVPPAIRRAVIARAGHCEWPGGCDRRPAACDVHHVRHKKDGGPASVTGCALFCDFHHDVCVHRWGRKIGLRAGGTVTARSPDGQEVLRGHPPPATRPA